MALSKHLDLSKIKITATDIDKQVIATAKVGLYSEKSIANVPDEFKRKYFTKVGNSSPDLGTDQEVRGFQRTQLII